MSPIVRLPAPLRDQANGQAEVELSGDSVAGVLDALVARYPSLRRHLFTEQGGLRGYVNLYRNDEVVVPGAEAATRLGDGDVVTIVPSIAGGTAFPRRGTQEP